jgi:hypothetical protein
MVRIRPARYGLEGHVTMPPVTGASERDPF